jgi:hypothetical protein
MSSLSPSIYSTSFLACMRSNFVGGRLDARTDVVSYELVAIHCELNKETGVLVCFFLKSDTPFSILRQVVVIFITTPVSF